MGRQWLKYRGIWVLCYKSFFTLINWPQLLFPSWEMKRVYLDESRLWLCSSLTYASPPSAGRLRVRDVGPCGHRYHGGSANCRCPVQHQDDSPQEEEQLQTPEEEGQTTRGQYPTCNYHFILVSCYWKPVTSYRLQHHPPWVSNSLGLAFCLFFFFSNLGRPARAIKTRPCCWPTALRMSSDETLQGSFCRWPMAGAPVTEPLWTSPLLWLLHL